MNEKIIIEELTKNKSRGDKRKSDFRHAISKKRKMLLIEKRNRNKETARSRTGHKEIIVSGPPLRDKRKLISCQQELDFLI